MPASQRSYALAFLRWSTGLVVLLQSWRTFHFALRHLSTSGHPAGLAHVQLLLSGVEMIAAALFLVPPSEKIGGYLLLGIFALAILIHSLHGDFSGMEILFVYAAAVFACLVFRTEPAQA